MNDRPGYQAYSFPPGQAAGPESAVPLQHFAPHPAPRPPPPPPLSSTTRDAFTTNGSQAAYPGYVAPATRLDGYGFTPLSPAVTESGGQSRSNSRGGNPSAASSSSGRGGNASSADVATGSVANGESASRPASKRARRDSSGGGNGPTPKGLTDKACKNCRVRKVRCDRQWPKCQRCKDRGEECDFGSMVPVDIIAELPNGAPNPRMVELEGQVATLKLQLAEASQVQLAEARRAATLSTAPKPVPILTEAIRASFLSGTRDVSAQQVDSFLASNVRQPLAWGGNVATSLSLSGLESQLARQQLARALSLHLVHSFFSSCCSFLPIFDPWHSRLPELCRSIDNLDPANQVAVTAFCAMGARASPHSALLGVHFLGPNDPNASLTAQSTMAAGVRREQACRSLHDRAIHLTFETDEILHDFSPVNFEALMVEIQMLAFVEFVPRRSRTLIRIAFGFFQELQNSQMSDTVKRDLSRAYSLPLFTCDAITAAYARKVPIITVADCRQYLRDVSIPDLSVDSLTSKIEEHLPPSLPKGSLTHDLLIYATHEVHAWLGQAQRAFAEMAVHHSPPAQFLSEVQYLWAVLDQMHQASQALQTTLINLDYSPIACGKDGCNDLHLRFITRLDRDTMDVTLLLHSLVKERQIEGPLGAVLYLESEKRVRNALKLVAFYSELYITSRDPHMTYHLFWQLELLPNWTEMVLQRFGEREGPATEALEVTEGELDWFLKGLSCAAYYHPIANGRLKQMEQNRRAERRSVPQSSSTTTASGLRTSANYPAPAGISPALTLDHPPHAQVFAQPPPTPYDAAYLPFPAPMSSGVSGAAQTSGTTIVAPVLQRGTPGDGMGEMQGGVTDPRFASMKWGDWSGHHLKEWEGTGLG